jgi:hypothetical protein
VVALAATVTLTGTDAEFESQFKVTDIPPSGAG